MRCHAFLNGPAQHAPDPLKRGCIKMCDFEVLAARVHAEGLRSLCDRECALSLNHGLPVGRSD